MAAERLNALDRHLALVGFMGAGKSTVGPEIAERLGRPFVSVDAVVEERAGLTVAELFGERGQEEFGPRGARRRRGTDATPARGRRARRRSARAELTRIALTEHAFTVLLETTPEQAWERVSSGGRPLANDQGEFWALFEQRTPLYEAVADGHARDADGVVLAAAGIHVWEGALDGLGGLAPGDDDIALVADERVDQLYGNRARTALGSRLTASHVVPAGERSKTVAQAEALWSTLRLDRAATIAALEAARPATS